MWPPWSNHKGCPYDAPPQRDFFTPSYAVGYILSPAERADFFNELLTQDTRMYPEICFAAVLRRSVAPRSQHASHGLRGCKMGKRRDRGPAGA